MGKELRDSFVRANTNDDVRVVIVTGSGRGFCAGADISGNSDGLGSRNERYAQESETRIENRFVDAIFACRKPSIAAINGPAVGVGVTMTLPMDIRIMSEEARFGFVFARRGLVPEAGSSWFLPRIVGLPQALRWCLDARIYGADEALHGGLVCELTKHAELLPRARAIARSIADGTSAVSIGLTRQMLLRSDMHPLPMPVLELDSQLVRELSQGADFKEGVRAFAEKRDAQFPGLVSRDMPRGAPWWAVETG
jgi:enoyl-CoA hydratase/carnithine racemase